MIQMLSESFLKQEQPSVKLKDKPQYNNKLKKELSDKSISSKKWAGNRKFTLDVDVQASPSLNIRASPLSQQVKKQTSSSRPLRRSADCLMLLLIISCSVHYHHSPLAISTSSPKLSGTSYATWIHEGHQGLMKFQWGSLKRVLQNWPVSLSHLFQLIFSRGMFPEQWKTARVIPVHKRDSKSDPSKYRPLSLLGKGVTELPSRKIHQGCTFWSVIITLPHHLSWTFWVCASTADSHGPAICPTSASVQDSALEYCAGWPTNLILRGEPMSTKPRSGASWGTPALPWWMPLTLSVCSQAAR